MYYYFEKDVLKCISDCLSNDESIVVNLCDDSADYQKKVKEGKISLPNVCATSCLIDYVPEFSEYTIRNKDGVIETKKSDFVRTLCGTVQINISVYAEDLPGLIKLEDTITASLKNGITIESSDSEFEDTVVMHMTATDRVDHKNLDADTKIYCSTIYAVIKDVVEFRRQYHSAEVELEKITQEELVNRYLCIDTFLKSKNIPTEDSLGNGLIFIKDLFGKIFSDKNNDEILDICHLMKENNVTIKDAVAMKGSGKSSNQTIQLQREEEQKKYDAAVALVNQRVKERQARIDEHEKLRKERIAKDQERCDEENRKEKEKNKQIKMQVMSTWGDPCINRFTNTVAMHLQKIMQEPVYDGTSFMEFKKKMFTGTLETPAILCEPFARLNVETKPYSNVNNQGYVINRYYMFTGEQLSYPLDYAVKFRVYAESDDAVSRMANTIKHIFEIPVTLYFQDPYFPNEMVKFDVTIPLETKLEIKTVKMCDKSLKTIELKSKFYRTVYYAQDFATDKITYDYWKQYRLVQQAQFYFPFKTEIERRISSLKNNTNDYNEIVNSSSDTLINLLDSAPLKALKKAIRQNRSEAEIKSLFYEAFSNYLSIYPFMYERYKQGWDSSKIVADIRNMLEFQRIRSEAICKQLDIKCDAAYLENLLNEMAKSHLYIIYFHKNSRSWVDDIISRPVHKKEEDRLFDKQIEDEKSEDIKILNDAKPSWVKEKERKEREAKEAQMQQQAIADAINSLTAAVVSAQQQQVQEQPTFEFSSSRSENRRNERTDNYRNDYDYQDRYEQPVRESNHHGGIINSAIRAYTNELKKPFQKKEKPDLIGTAGCNLSKGGVNRCNVFCNLWNECKRGS